MSNYLLMPAEAKEHNSLFVDCQRLAINYVESPAECYCVVFFVTFLQMSSLNAYQPTDSTPIASENGESFTCCLPTKQHSNIPLYNPIHYSALFHFIWCSLTFSAIDKLLLIMYFLNKGHLIGIFHTIMPFFLYPEKSIALSNASHRLHFVPKGPISGSISLKSSISKKTNFFQF